MGSQAEALDAEKQIGPALEKIGARLVAVSHQTFGLAEFQRKYFRGDIYLDIDKDMYKAFGSQHGGADDIAKPGVMEAGRKAYKMLKAKDPSYKLDSTGEGALLGGSQFNNSIRIRSLFCSVVCFFLVISRTLIGCLPSPPLDVRRMGGAPHQCPLGVGS